MNRIRQTISFALVLALLSLGMTAQAQRRTYRLNDRQVGELIRRVEMSTDRFRATVDTALDRSRYDGTRAEDDINTLIRNFESATDTLRDRFDRRVSVAADVETVLQQANLINDFMMRNRLNARAQNDWTLVRTDLNALARAYNVSPNWGTQGGSAQTGGTFGSQRPYRINDRQVDMLIQRIENSADRFKSSLNMALDRSRYDNTRSEDNINQFVRDFENATDALRDRFNRRVSVAGDVENVLQRASFINDFMRRNALTRRAQNDWNLLRTDLNELATSYNVAWNWDNTNTFPTPGGNYSASGRLTGTYRLDPSRSDNARDVAERATRNLPLGERQRVYDRLIQRLESPEMLAIDRSGMMVDIASSRAPRTTFEADGRDRSETLPNGMTTRVSATLNGDSLVVRSIGVRENDFTVTFEPVEGGSRLRVRREIWSDRLGQNPVVVQNFYNRTSDVAQWNIFDNNNSPFGTGSADVGTSGDFVIRDGEVLTATLDTDLSTRQAQAGDRFTMTVQSPAQYAGAVIEGSIANVDRGGRVTGRSEVALNLDNIRMRDGRNYRFAGFIESARTLNGETISVDNEGSIRDNSQTNKTVQRAAIGTAVGAIIGAIAGGGKGAAIGAIVGAGAGAGSVYVQGRDELELPRGSEITVRASAPNNR